MGYKHDRGDLLAAAIAVAHEDGLSSLTFGRVAKRLGISDRVVVYYFPTKDDLVGEVIVGMGTQVQAALVPALTEPAADHLDLLRRAWPVLADEEADRAFALFFEANGLASAGRQPYASLVPHLVEGWIDWTAR
ncbi:MAG: helix-turn-helix domain-containing protein [Actinomycetota bacterium]